MEHKKGASEKCCFFSCIREMKLYEFDFFQSENQCLITFIHFNVLLLEFLSLSLSHTPPFYSSIWMHWKKYWKQATTEKKDKQRIGCLFRIALNVEVNLLLIFSALLSFFCEFVSVCFFSNLSPCCFFLYSYRLSRSCSIEHHIHHHHHYISIAILWRHIIETETDRRSEREHKAWTLPFKMGFDLRAIIAFARLLLLFHLLHGVSALFQIETHSMFILFYFIYVAEFFLLSHLLFHTQPQSSCTFVMLYIYFVGCCALAASFSLFFLFLKTRIRCCCYCVQFVICLVIHLALTWE